MARRPTDSANWGGARLGSGAKPRQLPPRAALHVQVPAAMRDQLRAAALAGGISMAHALRDALDLYLRRIEP
jgi:hypothetical protein